MLAPPGRRRVGCGHSIRAAGVRLRDGIGRRKRSVVVEQPEQFQEEGTCDTLREDVGNHDGTASVAQRDDVALGGQAGSRAQRRTYSRNTPVDGGWRRCAGVCSEVRKRVYTCGAS